MAVSRVWLSLSRYARNPKMADKVWQLRSAEFHENTTNGLVALSHSTRQYPDSLHASALKALTNNTGVSNPNRNQSPVSPPSPTHRQKLTSHTTLRLFGVCRAAYIPDVLTLCRELCGKLASYSAGTCFKSWLSRLQETASSPG
jgi:hypothetical protein